MREESLNKISHLVIVWLSLGFAACSTNGAENLGTFTLPDAGKEKQVDLAHEWLITRYALLLKQLEVADPQGQNQREILEQLVGLGTPLLPLIEKTLEEGESPELRSDLLYVQVKILEEQAPEGQLQNNDNDIEEENGVSNHYDQGYPAFASDRYGLEPHRFGAVEDYEPEELEKFIFSRYLFAYEKLQNNQIEDAEEICKALLLLAPKNRYRREIQTLLLQTRTGIVATRSILGSLKFSEQFIQPRREGDKETFELHFSLTNVGAESLEINLGESQTESSLSLVLSFHQRDAFQSEHKKIEYFSLRIQGGRILLKPGESYSFKHEVQNFIEVLKEKQQEPLLTWVEVYGELRPQELIAKSEEERRIYRPILLNSTKSILVPSFFNLQQAQKNLVAFLLDRLEAKDFDSVSLLAPFVDAQTYREVLDILLDQNIENKGLDERRIRLALAEQLLEKSFQGNISKARIYWQNIRYRY